MSLNFVKLKHLVIALTILVQFSKVMDYISYLGEFCTIFFYDICQLIASTILLSLLDKKNANQLN